MQDLRNLFDVAEAGVLEISMRPKTHGGKLDMPRLPGRPIVRFVLFIVLGIAALLIALRFPGAWPYVLSIEVAIAWLTSVAMLITRQRRDPLSKGLPTALERESAAKALWDLYPAFPDDEPDTALFLLEESKRSYDGWVESNARLEAKATWLTGFLAGGAGLLTVISSVHGDKTGLAGGPFLILALVAAFGALAGCLYVLRPKLRPHPSVADYVSPALAISPKARFHLALSLAEEYNENALVIARLRRYDPIAWTAAQASLATAVIAILIHFWISVIGNPAANSKAVVECRGQGAPYRAGTAWNRAARSTDLAEKPIPSYQPPPTPPSSGQMHEGWTPTPTPALPTRPSSGPPAPRER